MSADPSSLPARLVEGVRVYRQARARDAAACPPPEKGQLLGTIASGARGELRLCWLWERDRPPVFSIRLWAEEADGQLWPVRAVGVSIPIHKLPALGEAVVKALELARDHEENQRPAWRPRR